MDEELLKWVKSPDVTPPWNPSIVNGLAVEHMMSVNAETGVNTTMAYIDRLININRDLYPPGLTYEGSQICSPIKQFEEVTREYKSVRKANIAKSDTYLVKYQFAFNGEPLQPRYVLLPYVRDGGLITLNGATYNIAPVLADVGYSVLRGSIFIPFRRTRLIFNRETYHFFANGKRDIVYVIWSMIHHEMSNRKKFDLDNRRSIHSCLAHYFFCRHGVTEAFRQWAKVDVRVMLRQQATKADYPQTDWYIFESSHLKGKHPTGDICLVYPKYQDSDFARMLVGGFFYVMDVFPNRFKEPEYVDDVLMWRLMLGNLIFGDFEHSGKLLENIETHMHSFDNSLDEITKEDLMGRGVQVDTIWDLLYAIMTTLAPHFYQTSTDEASMYNKRLMVLRYVLEEFNSAITMFGYTFQSRRDKTWGPNEINDALKRSFRLKTCIRNLTSEHGEFDTISYPGDNKFFRITSMLVPQDQASKRGGYSKGLITDASRLLHASIAEVGQYNNQPKTNPDGRSRINPCVLTEVDGTIRRNPERRELIDKTQKRFSR